jgi:predicted site-specific integrase-resolvase
MMELLNREAAREFLQISKSTLARWEAQGLLRRFKAPGLRGRVLYRRQALEQFILEREQGSTKSK